MKKSIAEIKLMKIRTSHLLHFVLSLLTAGLWVPVWILVTVSNKIEEAKLVRIINKAES